MAVKVVKGRPPPPEFTDAPDVAAYSGAVESTYTPDRIPYMYFGENQIRDNSMLDTVVGTPGTLPANISVVNAVGLTISISANEVVDGLTYAKINFDGTATGATLVMNLEAATQIAALNGQTWGYSAYLGFAGSDTSKVTSGRLRIAQRTSGGASIANLDSSTFPVVATPVRRSFTSTLTGGATVAFINPQLLINVQNGQVIHLTIYVAMHVVEQSIVRNQPVATYGYPQPTVWIPNSPIKVDPKRFGALGNSVQATNGSWTGTDDTVAIAKACATVRRLREKAILDLSEGYYTVTDQLVSTAIARFRMQGRGDDSRLIMKTSARDANFVLFDFAGSLNQAGVPTGAGTYFLTSPGSAGDSTLTMNTTASLVENQWLQMVATAIPVLAYFDVFAGTVACLQGQPIKIKSVDSSTQITIDQFLEFNYPATTTQFKIYDAAMKTDYVLENFVIDQDILDPPTSTHTRVRFRNVADIKVYDFKAFGQGNSLTFDASLNVDVDTCQFIDGNNLSYCVSFNNGGGIAHCHNLYGYNIRHLVQGGSDTTSIEAQHILVTGSRGESCNLGEGVAGGIPFSGHVTMRHVDFVGNMAMHSSVGHQLRGRWMRAVQGTNIACGYGVEIADCCGDGSEVVGGMSRACNIGIRVVRATKAIISGSPHIINSVLADLQLENQYYDTPFTPYPGLKVVDMRVEGTPSVANVNYVMRTANGQVTPTYGDDWEINVRGITNKPTYKVTNADGVTDSTIPFMGEHAFKQATKTASFTCLVGQSITYIVQPAASAIAVTVPDATLWTGERSRLRFVKSGVGVGVITLTAVSGNINGAASAVLTTFMTIESDGTNWFIVA